MRLQTFMRRCCACICSGDQTRSLNMQRQADDTDARAAAQPAAARGPRRGALLHFSWAGRGRVWRAGYMAARASLGWIPQEGDTLHVVIKAWGKRPVVRLSAAASLVRCPAVVTGPGWQIPVPSGRGSVSTLKPSVSLATVQPTPYRSSRVCHRRSR